MTTAIPIPNVLYRSPGFVQLQFINNPDITGYRILAANSLNNAYGPDNGVGGVGPTVLPDLDTQRGTTRITRPIRQKGTAISGDITRGQTRITFDPNEFFGLSPEIPADAQLWFVRTQVRTTASPAFPGAFNNLNSSDILIVQDPNFFVVPRPAVTLAGTAPDVGAVAGDPPPAESMIFHLPAFADALVLINTSASPLFLATGRHQPMMVIPAGEMFSHTSGMKDEIVVAGSGANPTFSLVVSTVAGDR